MLEILDQRLTHWAAGLGWPLEAAFRMVLAVIIGGLIGLEREVRGREAGFRTNLLVCLGSTIAMVVSVQFAYKDWADRVDITIVVDPARVAYGIMAGVGFLGAGAIIQQRGNIHGLTTAAALWCVAATGLAIGLGLYGVAILAGMLILSSLWLLDYAGAILPRTSYRTVTVRSAWSKHCIGEAVDYFKQKGVRVLETSFDRSSDLESVTIRLRVAFHRKRQFYDLEERIQEESGLTLLSVK